MAATSASSEVVPAAATARLAVIWLTPEVDLRVPDALALRLREQAVAAASAGPPPATLVRLPVVNLRTRSEALWLAAEGMPWQGLPAPWPAASLGCSTTAMADAFRC